MQEYTEELYKICLSDLDNHNSVVTHLEPNVLEYEFKWALGSITKKKVSGGDGIPAELFQILKEDDVKCYIPCMAKSLQSCLILLDPMHLSLPGSSVHDIPQAKILE